MFITTLHQKRGTEKVWTTRTHHQGISVPHSTAGLKLSFPDTSSGFKVSLLQCGCSFCSKRDTTRYSWYSHAVAKVSSLLKLCHLSELWWYYDCTQTCAPSCISLWNLAVIASKVLFFAFILAGGFGRGNFYAGFQCNALFKNLTSSSFPLDWHKKEWHCIVWRDHCFILYIVIR